MRPVGDGAHDDLSSLDATIDDATTQGVHLVASPGNTGDTRVTYPAASFADGSGDTKYRSVSVGSVRADTRRSSFSTATRCSPSAPSRSPPIAGDDDQTRLVGSGRLNGRHRGRAPGGATGFGVSRVETARLVPVPA